MPTTAELKATLRVEFEAYLILLGYSGLDSGLNQPSDVQEAVAWRDFLAQKVNESLVAAELDDSDDWKMETCQTCTYMKPNIGYAKKNTCRIDSDHNVVAWRDYSTSINGVLMWDSACALWKQSPS